MYIEAILGDTRGGFDSFVIMLHTRKRRAAPKDIYPTCKIMNNCPSDIQNKIENTTIADKILQYGSLGVFFGGLGIGTGKGSGGRLGYLPMGEGGGVRVGGASIPVRPTIPVDTVGPRELLPVSEVDPMGPSVIPLEDLSTFHTNDVEVIAEIHPGSDLPTSTTIGVTQDEGTAAILHVGVDSPSLRAVSRSQYNNPVFNITTASNISAGESSATDNIFVHSHTGGQSVGEEIPLVEFHSGRGSTYDTNIIEETGFQTSTPKGATVQERPTRFYNRRYYEQREITDPAFISQPRTLVTFDNPTFDEEISLIFEKDLSNIASAPHEDFRDVIRLSRPVYSKAPDGRLRLSRVGQSATIKTRSGTIIGPRTHFYHDFSSIEPIDTIELQPLGEQSGESVIISGDNVDVSTPEIVDQVRAAGTFSDEDLIDTMSTTVGENLQLVITGSRNRTVNIQIPSYSFPRIPESFYPSYIDNGVHVFYPEDTKGNPSVIPNTTPLITIHIDNTTGDYEFDPSLFRKRKRVLF